MIFDRLCGIAERHMPAICPVLQRAHLFHFPDVAHSQVIADRFESFSEEEMQFVWDEFRMPYAHMAVEDQNSCVVLWEEEETVGFTTQRFAMECMSLTDALAPFADAPHIAEAFGDYAAKTKAKYGELFMVTIGKIRGVRRTGGGFSAEFEGTVGFAMTGNKKLVRQNWHMLKERVDSDVIVRGFVRNTRAALEEIVWFNSPDRFVVKKTPAHRKRPLKKGKVARSDQRPTFTLLTPTEIRDSYGMGAGGTSTGGARLSRQRRGHWRRYTAERFSEEVRKKPRWIKAVWVGSTSAVKGKHRYEILLDK